MKVFSIQYGNADTNREKTQQLFANYLDALDSAIASAEAILDEDPELVKEGFSHYLASDRKGNTVVAISKQGESKKNDWWTIVERHVY